MLLGMWWMPVFGAPIDVMVTCWSVWANMIVQVPSQIWKDVLRDGSIWKTSSEFAQRCSRVSWPVLMFMTHWTIELACSYLDAFLCLALLKMICPVLLEPHGSFKRIFWCHCPFKPWIFSESEPLCWWIVKARNFCPCQCSCGTCIGIIFVRLSHLLHFTEDAAHIFPSGCHFAILAHKHTIYMLITISVGVLSWAPGEILSSWTWISTISTHVFTCWAVFPNRISKNSGFPVVSHAV